jgi:phospholipid transport system substrate-binding protein
MMRKFATIFSALVLTAALARGGDSSAGVPTDQVRATVNRVLMILKDPALNSAGAKEARRAELSKAILPRFDFEEMAKRSLGAEWRRRTPAEQKEFARLITALLKDSYVDSIESYRGEKVVYRGESQDGDYADVGTKMIDKRGQEFAIGYRLNLKGSEWKVYDVIIENISIVNNYRSQFQRILSGSSFAELLRRVGNKVD